ARRVPGPPRYRAGADVLRRSKRNFQRQRIVAPDLQGSDLTTLLHGRMYGAGIDHARDDLLAHAAWHHQSHRALCHQRHATLAAAERLGVSDDLALLEQHTELEVMEAPFDELLAFVRALLLALEAVDRH